MVYNEADHNPKYHHSSFSAFCRNYGDYSTKAIGHCHWNEEAIAAASRDLRRLWDDFTLSIEDYVSDLMDGFNDSFTEIRGGIFSQSMLPSPTQLVHVYTDLPSQAMLHHCKLH
jgi:hypothetical protein